MTGKNDELKSDLPYGVRQLKLAAELESAGLEALVLNPGPSLVYLTGLHFHLSERPVLVLLHPQATARIILPGLEAGKVAELPFEAQVYTYGEDPTRWEQSFRRALEDLPAGMRLGVEPGRLRLLEAWLLENTLPEAILLSAERSLARLRMIKEPAEVAAMRAAVTIAQNALQETLPNIRVGMTEIDLASELTLQLFRHGSEPELPFSPIVASGPNSANPHAFPTRRALGPGDLLVLDWGAASGGYLSDLTRTFAIEPVKPEMARVASVVQQANSAGQAAVRPGQTAGRVDQVAREVIVASGLGEYFPHRTGHGLGLEGHEQPYLYAENSLPLAAGMTFTIEPGVYLPGRGGVRVEDNLVVTPLGSESLSDLPRELIIVG